MLLWRIPCMTILFIYYGYTEMKFHNTITYYKPASVHKHII